MRHASCLLAVLASTWTPRAAAAHPDADLARSSGAPGATRTPSITVSAGAVLPVFLLYELPGPWIATSLVWPMTERTQLVASADTGLLLASGATRLLGSLGGGVRISPSRCVPLWMQVGLGVTGYAERIGVALPARAARATDLGVALTADLAVGFRITPRWEIAVGYDHQLVSSEDGSSFVLPGVSQLRETLPFVATGMVSIGRRL